MAPAVAATVSPPQHSKHGTLPPPLTLSEAFEEQDQTGASSRTLTEPISLGSRQVPIAFSLLAVTKMGSPVFRTSLKSTDHSLFRVDEK